MDFNIKKFLNVKNKEILKDSTTQRVIEGVHDFFPDLRAQNISFNKGLLVLKNISPQQKFYIKLHKQEIITTIKQKYNISIRDII